MNKLVTEFVGTFFLVLTIVLSIAQAPTYAPFAIGLMLMAMVYMGGPISGAHYNPAVTIAVWLRKKITTGEALPYMAVQLLAAVIAGLLGQYLVGKVIAPAPAPDPTFFKPWVIEILLTFALVLVVLNVATVKRAHGHSYYGVAIGLTVTAAAIVGGTISGGAFNPAVGLGLILAAGIHGDTSYLQHIPLYIVGPCAGAIAAVSVFQLQHGSAEIV